MIPQKIKMNGGNMTYSIINMNPLQKCNINNFGFITINMPSKNITKLINKLDNNLFNKYIKKIKIKTMNSEKTIDNLFGTNAKY